MQSVRGAIVGMARAEVVVLVVVEEEEGEAARVAAVADWAVVVLKGLD